MEVYVARLEVYVACLEVDVSKIQIFANRFEAVESNTFRIIRFRNSYGSQNCCEALFRRIS